MEAITFWRRNAEFPPSAQMLGVLDAETAIARAVLLAFAGKCRGCGGLLRPIAWIILQAGLVRGGNPLEHDAFRQHLLEEQALVFGRGHCMAQTKRRWSAEAAVGKTFLRPPIRSMSLPKAARTPAFPGLPRR